MRSLRSVSLALALLLGLAHAQDRLQPGVERRRDLLLERAVGLAEVLAALGVPEHHAVDAELVSISAETSPVKAPLDSWCMFCAYTATPAAAQLLDAQRRAR